MMSSDDSSARILHPRAYSARSMTRSKEIRRIEAAIEHRDESELRWALTECEVRKKWMKGHSHLWYRLEKQIRAALSEVEGKPE